MPTPLLLLMVVVVLLLLLLRRTEDVVRAARPGTAAENKASRPGVLFLTGSMTTPPP